MEKCRECGAILEDESKEKCVSCEVINLKMEELKQALLEAGRNSCALKLESPLLRKREWLQLSAPAAILDEMRLVPDRESFDEEGCDTLSQVLNRIPDGEKLSQEANTIASDMMTAMDACGDIRLHVRECGDDE